MHRAAEHLFISAQGLGKIIKNLEHEYNTTFFVRSQNGVIPTDSAKLFYDWSKEFVLQDAHIKTEINNIHRKESSGFSKLKWGTFNPEEHTPGESLGELLDISLNQ